jgi:hypothetical protein
VAKQRPLKFSFFLPRVPIGCRCKTAPRVRGIPQRNYDRQSSIMSDNETAFHKAILKNQAEILKNQATIKKNQQDIKANQKKLDQILANQKSILANQKKILAK